MTSANPPSPLVVTQRILTRTRGTQRKLKPQIVLVVRALIAAGRDVDGGFSTAELAAPLPLKGAKLVEVLQATFSEDTALAKRIEAVVAQYQEAEATLGQVERELAAGEVPPARVEALKQAAYFLSSFHASMQGDALLAQVFPPPAYLQAGAEHAEIS